MPFTYMDGTYLCHTYPSATHAQPCTIGFISGSRHFRFRHVSSTASDQDPGPTRPAGVPLRLPTIQSHIHPGLKREAKLLLYNIRCLSTKLGLDSIETEFEWVLGFGQFCTINPISSEARLITNSPFVRLMRNYAIKRGEYLDGVFLTESDSGFVFD